MCQELRKGKQILNKSLIIHNRIIKPCVTSFDLVISPFGFYTNAVVLNHLDSKPPLSKKIFKALLSEETCTSGTSVDVVVLKIVIII